MSKRHLFNSQTGLVNKSLRGIITYNSHLGLDEQNRVVYDTRHDKSKISIISGGGSGHEPAWAGYVGANMLSASVAGDIFASPSTKQILSAIEAVPSDPGILLVVTNYTGDCLHFGLANEKANARGQKCRMIVCGDDVSIGRTRGKLVGRRGLAGQIAVLKIVGAAVNEEGASLDTICNLTEAVATHTVSIAATIDHCHVPGRAEHAQLDPDTIELGTGPHNEPGYEKVSPAPSPEEFVAQMLRYCLDPEDTERAYVQFQHEDKVVLLVSNFGGMSYLEMGALVDELLDQLAKNWKIKPVRVYCGPLETSLNAPAFSISLMNITAASRECSFDVAKIESFLDAKTDTYWESLAGSQTDSKSVPARIRQQTGVDAGERRVSADLTVEPAVLEKSLRSACALVIEAEPDLTDWDTKMGDGDCGQTFETGARALLDALDKKGLASKGSVVSVLYEIEDVVESKMGGTLGGILGIFFVSLTTAMVRELEKSKNAKASDVWSKALPVALERLEQYTGAREGDRTIMDILIPFVNAMHDKSFEHAVEDAVQAAEATRKMKPKYGRATYVSAGGQDLKKLPPDPGAWGAMCVLKGLRDGLKSDDGHQ